MTIKKQIEEQIKQDGLMMVKKISRGGFLGNPTCDKRMVYSLEDMYKLTTEGFKIYTNLGLLLFKAIIK
jgi:hypothetical protein